MSKDIGPTTRITGRARRLNIQAADASVNLVLSGGGEPDHGPRSHRSPRPSGTGWPRLLAPVRLLLLLITLWGFRSDIAADAFNPEYEKPEEKRTLYENDRIQRIARERQELHRKRVSITEAVKSDALNVSAAKQAIARGKVRNGSLFLASLMAFRPQDLCLAALFILAGALVMRQFAPEIAGYINERFNAWLPVPALLRVRTHIREEEGDFTAFVSALQMGPSGANTARYSKYPGAESKVDPLIEFHESVKRLLPQMRKQIVEVAETANTANRQQLIKDLQREIQGLKDQAGELAMLPVWQLTSALEGLLKQLTQRAANVTASTLRTALGGINLLGNLCTAGVDLDALIDAPLRFLTVDDDLISRTAVSLALKKAFSTPDLAENGEKALVLTTKQAYDVIFLDVQMPGMDGFELCSRIHESDNNRTTPVVFVTCMTEFDARAASHLDDGFDLLGKPFLTFEITVKALTLALSGRLMRLRAVADDGTDNQEAGTRLKTLSNTETVIASNGSTQSPEPRDATISVQTHPAFSAREEKKHAAKARGKSRRRRRAEARERRNKSRPEEAAATGETSIVQVDVPTATPATPSEDPSLEIGKAFIARATLQLGPIRDTARKLAQMDDVSGCSDDLGDLYLRLSSLTPENSPDLDGHPAFRLSRTLSGLVKKLIEKPEGRTPSSLASVANAVELLHDIWLTGTMSGLPASSTFRMLVVDDDPIARRAMACALQMAFDKPECVDCGEAALAAATEKAFDVIFMDVQMPAMDGFTACSKIRQTDRNGNTPVVFVTARSDAKAREQAESSGGNDFIQKPFMTSEVTVKALTFALRSKLPKPQAARK